MTVVVLILIGLAILFGVGAVLEGLAWLALIGLALVAVAVFVAWRKFRELVEPQP